MPSKVCDVKMEEQISGVGDEVGEMVGARVGDKVGELVMTTAGCACTSMGEIVCTSSANSGLLTAFSIAVICSSSVAPPSVPDDTSRLHPVHTLHPHLDLSSLPDHGQR